jgi:hypothetical protein
MRSGVLRAFFALLCAALTAASAEAGTQVQKVWGPLLPREGGFFLEAAPRDDGSVLAATGKAVSAIDPQGGVSLLGQGDRALLNPGGETYALLHQGNLDVFDAVGQPLGGFAVTGSGRDIFKLIPGTDLVYAPRVHASEETVGIDSVRIVDPNLKPVGEFDAHGLEISRFAADRIVFTQPKLLEARGLDGSLLWHAEVDVHKLETAADWAIVVPRYRKGQVLHYFKGERAGAQAVEGTVWNLAISPAGRFSVATTRTILYLFQDGRLIQSIPIRVESISAVDVSDRGEVLVSGQPAQMFLYDSRGALLWQEAGGADPNAYRPGIHFAPKGDRFIVIEKRGLSAYAIERSQP